MVRDLALTALISLGFAASVAAQSLSTQVHLGWTAPTTNTDGSAISGALTYTLYQASTVNGPWTKATSGITGTTTVVSSVSAGLCFELTAVENSVESAPSAAACAVQANPPTGTTVTITVTLSSAQPATQAPEVKKP